MEIEIQKIRADYYRAIDSRRETTVKLPCVNERTKFDGFTYWWFWITLAAIVLRAGWKYGNRWLKSINWP